MTGQLVKHRQLPPWWSEFVESHPAVPNIVAVTGLVFILFMLLPSVTHPSERGRMIDSLAVVGSDTVVGKAIALRAAYHRLVPQDVRDYTGEILFNPVLYLVVPFLMLLEYLFPCKPSQPLVGKGFLQDFLWFVAAAPTRLLLLGAASGFLMGLYNSHLAFLTIDGAAAWPRALQVAAGLVVVEFLFWVSHVIRHKILTLWFFHAVHHSQKVMNAFTEDRSHVVDKLVSSLFMFVPLYMFQVPNLYAVAIVGLYMSIHSRFVHVNAKINLGWLGWIVASPQFHRIHHSADPAHADKNFAGVLSALDYLFGTAYPSRDIYPETGINDAEFPFEDGVGVLRLPGNWFKQVSFPFTQVFKQIAPGLSARHEVADRRRSADSAVR